MMTIIVMLLLMMVAVLLLLPLLLLLMVVLMVVVKVAYLGGHTNELGAGLVKAGHGGYVGHPEVPVRQILHRRQHQRGAGPRLALTPRQQLFVVACGGRAAAHLQKQQRSRAPHRQQQE